MKSYVGFSFVSLVEIYFTIIPEEDIPFENTVQFIYWIYFSHLRITQSSICI